MATPFLILKSQLPRLGIGIGLRRELAGDAVKNSHSIDWLEFVPENYMGIGGKARVRLEIASSTFPLIAHGVNLSIGSADKLNKEYLTELKFLLDHLNCPWWSDHLSFSSFNGMYLHDLMPLPFSQEAANHVVDRIKEVKQFISRPFLLENISAYLRMPGAMMSEAEFITHVVEQADCGLLLDVNNVYVNSQNFCFDPYAFIDSLPLERVVQIHIAGHSKNIDMLVDTHGESIDEAVYDLLEYTLQKADVNGILLERDKNFPDFIELLEELDRIRVIAAKHTSMVSQNASRNKVE